MRAAREVLSGPKSLYNGQSVRRKFAGTRAAVQTACVEFYNDEVVRDKSTSPQHTLRRG